MPSNIQGENGPLNITIGLTIVKFDDLVSLFLLQRIGLKSRNIIDR